MCNACLQRRLLGLGKPTPVMKAFPALALLPLGLSLQSQDDISLKLRAGLGGRAHRDLPTLVEQIYI